MVAPVSAAYLFIMFARRRQFSARRLSSRKEAKRGHPCGAHYAAILGCAAVKDSYVTNVFAGHSLSREPLFEAARVRGGRVPQDGRPKLPPPVRGFLHGHCVLPHSNF